MTNGNTLIRNALVGTLGDPTKDGEETYLNEEDVLEQAEDLLMDGDITSEEECKVERQMLTAALVNSVVDSSSKTSAEVDEDEGEKTGDDSKQRYSLRKRRRTSGEPSSSPGSPAKAKEAISSRTAAIAPPPPAAVSPKAAAGRPSPVKPPIVPGSSPPPSTKRAKTATTAPQTPGAAKAASPRTRGKPEAVPAVTVAAPATPLPVPLTIQASALPKTSTLPAALQPPLRPKPVVLPKERAQAASTAAAAPKPPSQPVRPKPNAKSQQKRLAPAVRVQSPAKPLTPNPGLAGVPNPLSIPLPKSKSILVTKQKKPVHPVAPKSYKAVARLTVPCPLPPSTFENDADRAANEAMPPPPSVPTGTELAVVEKKKVTIAPEPESTRGRIFSIDLDPASLDFSILDSGENGTPAPASADLPLVTGGSRDRAFSFECFAFGISADEALPPLSEQSGGSGGEARQQEMLELPRPRGDSIIFDPVSFQEGGIHEEHALTTREIRGLSMDLNAANLNNGTPRPPPSASGVTKYVPAAVASSSGHLAPGHPGATLPPSSHQNAPAHHYPEAAPSSIHGATAPHHHLPPHVHYAKPQQHSGQHHPHHAHPQPHMVSSGGLPHPHEMHANGGVAIIGACATSTALQMELLNKDGRIGIYLPEARRERIARFHAKRKMRIWRKRIKYDCRKKLADSRPRIKGRFVKRTDTD